MSPATYGDKFFEDLDEPAQRSAKIVLEHIAPYFKPSSVIDVGCGSGQWLKQCIRLFSAEVFGVDGPWNNAIEDTGIPYQYMDFEKPILLERTFDMAICLEVAEHLRPLDADRLIKSLVNFAPVILFSAAVEQQPGENHVNCMCQSAWMKKFESLGYCCVDVLRPMIWSNDEVAWWYKQNIFLAVRPGVPLLTTDFAKLPSANPVDVVHPENYVSCIRGHIRNENEMWKLIHKPSFHNIKDFNVNYVRRKVRGAVALARKRLRNR